MKNITHTRVLICFAVAIVCLLGTLVIRHRVQENAPKRVSEPHYVLCSLYNAFLTYEQYNGALPAMASTSGDGAALCSWRYLVLPFVTDSKREFNPREPWDSVVNQKWRESPNPLGNSDERTVHAKTFGIVGANSAFDAKRQTKLGELPPWLWVVVHFKDSKHHWMKPGDITAHEFRDILNRDSTLYDIEVGPSFFALSADGTVVEVSAEAPWEAVAPFVTLDATSSELRKAISPFVQSTFKCP